MVLCPAFITIRGMEANKTSINLTFLLNPIFHPRTSSVNPTNEIISNVLIRAKISSDLSKESK